MILDEICDYKREEIARAKAAVSQAELEERIREVRPARDFRAALRTPGISLIAEVKLASPTKGVFLEDTDPVDLGQLYEEAGAHALSVLTDEKYFRGSLNTLTALHNRVRIPCLRKDFILDEYQVYEARAAEADAILLIVRCLDDRQLADYGALARELGMATLVETHNTEEIERALEADAHIIGINNRDLSSFTVDLNLTLELKKLVPGGKVLVSESGIFSRDDAKMLENGGIDAILVGEALVTSGDIMAKVKELIGSDAG